MHRLFKKEEILTVPNLLSLIRLLLIPLIVWLYLIKADYISAVIVIALSGITDILDGYIARHYNMVSDLGKIIDPIADKLTQFAMIVCLYEQYHGIRYLLTLFVIKEIIMAYCGWLAIQKKDSVNSSQWFGKATTVSLYATMIILFLFPSTPEIYANIFLVFCGGMIILSLIKYLIFYRKLFTGKISGN